MSNTEKKTETDTTVETAICGLCKGVSWTTKSPTTSVSEKDVAEVMKQHPDRKDWCSCTHVLSEEEVGGDFPPKAGTGERSEK